MEGFCFVSFVTGLGRHNVETDDDDDDDDENKQYCNNNFYYI
jgi:hypothetical protein